MKKYWWLIVLAVVVAYFCLALAVVVHRTHLNGVAGKKIVHAMNERYPRFSCEYSVASYESPSVVIRVLGTNDVAEQEEIRSYLKQFKAENLPEFEVWLRFDDSPVVNYSDTSNKL